MEHEEVKQNIIATEPGTYLNITIGISSGSFPIAVHSIFILLLPASMEFSISTSLDFW
jgi:hypothetical protein